MKPLDQIFPDAVRGADAGRLDLTRVPKHVAVIMDGNGRWAKQRALNRLRGHKAGIEAVRETIRAANDLGVRYLTIYSFSTENWKRPQDEVDGLMELFAKTMLAEVDGLHAEGVRVQTIGDMSALPAETREAFEDAAQLTGDNPGMTLVVAVNYGARDEITRAARLSALQAVRAALGAAGPASLDGLDIDALAEAVSADLSQEDIASNLYTADIPDPELIIRTSGEMRLSNFLLWQAAYSEFISSPVLWPDFDRYELLRCLLEYQSRDRRFGGVDDE